MKANYYKNVMADLPDDAIHVIERGKIQSVIRDFVNFVEEPPKEILTSPKRLFYLTLFEGVLDVIFYLEDEIHFLNTLIKLKELEQNVSCDSE